MSETVTKPMEEHAQPEKQAPLDWGTPAQLVRQLGLIALVLACWGLVLGVILAPQPGLPIADIPAGQQLTWDEHVYPIMQRNCVLCHGASGGLALTSYERALAGSASGPAIVPGDAANSLLYKLLLGPAEGLPAMPLDPVKIISQRSAASFALSASKFKA